MKAVTNRSITTSVRLPRTTYDLVRDLAYERVRSGAEKRISASAVVEAVLQQHERELRDELDRLRQRTPRRRTAR